MFQLVERYKVNLHIFSCKNISGFVWFAAFPSDYLNVIFKFGLNKHGESLLLVRTPNDQWINRTFQRCINTFTKLKGNSASFPQFRCRGERLHVWRRWYKSFCGSGGVTHRTRTFCEMGSFSLYLLVFQRIRCVQSAGFYQWEQFDEDSDQVDFNIFHSLDELNTVKTVYCLSLDFHLTRKVPWMFVLNFLKHSIHLVFDLFRFLSDSL